MATEKWIGGGQASFTSIMTSELTSTLVDGDAIRGSTDIDNTSNLDMFAEFQLNFGSITTGATPVIGLYLYPLNQDGSTYGDGRFGSVAAGPPPSQFFAGIAFPVPSVTQAQQVPFRRPDGAPIIIPPYKFRPVIYNKTGATFAAFSTNNNILYYRTFNRQVA